MDLSCHTWICHDTHIWISHDTHSETKCCCIRQNCRHQLLPYSGIRMSYGTHMDESFYTHKWAMSHIWMGDVTYMNKPCHTARPSAVASNTTAAISLNRRATTTRWDMIHSHVRRDEFTRAIWHIHTCDMTHSYVWHDSCVFVTWLICMLDMNHPYVWHDSFICVTRLIRMCDMTHSYVWHDSFICVTWLIRKCDMTHSYVWRD